MAKKTYTTVGSICKPKDGGSPYIQIRKDLKTPVVLKAGDSLQLRSPKFQKESLEKAVKENKISPDFAQKQFERLEKIPEYVLFEISQGVSNE